VETEFERYLVEQCAPTLAGIKAGSLFYYAAKENENIDDLICGWNAKLLGKGVRIFFARRSTGGGLVYVFRPSALDKLLSKKDVRAFLEGRGFSGCRNPEAYVEQLRQRLCGEPGFPHEIGIFLGYPLHDVQGFIQNGGKNFDFCGLWKVYDKQRFAKRLFKRYKKCKSLYRTMFEKGRGVLELTIAA